MKFSDVFLENDPTLELLIEYGLNDYEFLIMTNQFIRIYNKFNTNRQVPHFSNLPVTFSYEKRGQIYFDSYNFSFIFPTSQIYNAPILQEVSYMGTVSGSYIVTDNSTCDGCGCRGSTCFKYNFYTARGGERQQLIIHTNKKSKEVKRNVIDFAKYFGIYEDNHNDNETY